jgi:zinc protease
LQIVVVERRDLPMVDVEIVITSGAELDLPVHAGRTSMTAEMIDEGTPTRAALDIAEQLDYLGAQLDVQPGWDTTAVSLQVLSPRLDPALDILADILLNATFPEAEFRRKQMEHLTSLLQERDEPHLLAGKALAASLFGPAHPYGAPIGGTHEAIERLTCAEVVARYSAQFRPASTFLIVVGDVDTTAIVAAIDARLGSWSGTAPVVAVPQATTGGSRRILVVDKPNAAQAELRVGHAAPPRDTADYFSLKVLNTVLGGSFTSRLNTILRERMGVTYGASSRFLLRRNGGLFTAGGAVDAPAAARSAQVIVEEMRRLMSERVPRAELQRAQSYLALGMPRSFETTEDIAAHLREQLLYGLPDDYWQTYVDRILAVTADDIMDAAARHLQPDGCVIAVVAEQQAVRNALEQTSLGDVVPTTVMT